MSDRESSAVYRAIIPGAIVLTVGVVAAVILAVIIGQSNGSAMPTLPTGAYTGYRFPSPHPLVLEIRLLYVAVAGAVLGALFLLLGLILRARARRARA